jgi:hypothetical protein
MININVKWKKKINYEDINKNNKMRKNLIPYKIFGVPV